MKQSLIVYWVRRDLRLTDNPALTLAAKMSNEKSIPLLPLFVLEDYMVGAEPSAQFGYPSRWFLAQALPRFGSQFAHFALVRGKAARTIASLSKKYELSVFVNDDVYPDFYTQVQKLNDQGVTVTVVPDALSVPKETRTGAGDLYSVFTPFKKNVWAAFVKVSVLPKVDTASLRYPEKEVYEHLDLVPLDEGSIWDTVSHVRQLVVGEHTIDLSMLTSSPELQGWYLDEVSALGRFDQYLSMGLLGLYNTGRDSLEGDTVLTMTHEGALEGKTSRMSLALAWGLVSSRMLMDRIRRHFDELFDNPFSDRVNQGALSYISELIWREFYRYVFFHNPALMHTEFQKRFQGTIAWVPDAIAYERFIAWIKGETGYPVVDAAMHQIAQTGWMHNRARMIVASILTKNLGVDWRWGQEYFRAALIDLDEASNNGGWQWGASVGADPKPIRIFNPELQAKNYDASGAYRNRWLDATEGVLLKQEIVPIVDHKFARDEALRRYGLSGTEPRDY